MMNKHYFDRSSKTLSHIAIALWLSIYSFNSRSVAAEYTVNEDVAPNSQETNNSRSELDFFRKLIDYYYASWAYWSDESGNVDPTELDDVAILYTENPDAIYYDPLPPIDGYRGWSEFGQVYKTWAKSNIVRADIRYGGDLRLFRLSDNLVYTTSLSDVDIYFANGRTSQIKPRMTHIWERQPNGRWLILHEHASSAVPEGSTPFVLDQPYKPSTQVQPDPEFQELVERFATIWSTQNGQIDWQAAEELYANEDDLVFFVPWQPRAGYVGWNSFKEGVQKNVFDGLNKLDLRINDDVEVTRRGDVAWTTSTSYVELNYQDGRSVKADGRMTMIWQQQDGNWQLIHEHFSVPVNVQ